MPAKTVRTRATTPLARILRSARRLLLISLTLLLFARLTGAAESLFYWPTSATIEPPFFAEDLWFQTPDGLRLHGWFMHARNLPPGSQAPAVLHIHGNAGNLEDHDSFSRFLTDHGLHVFIFDYRSYGQSESRRPLRRDALLRDANAALDALLNHPDVDPARVGVYGVSLGGAFALPLTANRPQVRALVTLAAFSSWTGVANDHVPLLGPAILPSGWDPVDFVPTLGARPWLIVQGTADEVVNVRHARIFIQAADRAHAHASLVLVQHARHNDIIQGYPEARSAIAAFFLRELGPP